MMDYETTISKETNVITPPLPINRIVKVKREYPVISASGIMETVKQKCRPAKAASYGTGKNKVFILPGAWNQLKTMVDFGMESPINKYEQQYQGLGIIARSPEGHVHIIVSRFLYCYSSKRSPVHSELDLAMFARLEYERELNRTYEKQCNTDEDGYQVNPFLGLSPYGSEAVLCGHTHPNLGCFFSQPDRKSGYYTEDFPAATFVCDPIRKDMKAIIGVKEEDAEVIVFEAYGYAAMETEKQGKGSNGALKDFRKACDDILSSGRAEGRYKVRKKGDRTRILLNIILKGTRRTG